MKVLYVATVFSHICEFHLPFMEIFKQRGYEVHVAGKDNLAEKDGRKLQFTDKAFDIPFTRSPLTKDNFRAFQILKKIIKEEKYDLIICNTPVGGLLSRLAAWRMRRRGTKVVYIVHGFHFYKGAPLLNWLVYYTLEKIQSFVSDKIITINNEDYLFAQKHFSCPLAHIHGIGVDEKKFFPVTAEEKKHYREKFGFQEYEKLLLCIGEFNQNKNQVMVIRALPTVIEKHPEVKLIFAGTGDLQPMLQATAEELKVLDHIVFLGYNRHLDEYQHAIDMVVSCSLREGLPLNIVESMMSGNPVVAADNRGHRELVDGDRNGFLVAINDCEAMGRRIVELLDNLDLYVQKKTCALQFIAPYKLNNVLREFFSYIK